MKTLLLSALGLTGMALSTPEAQAKNHKHHDRDRDSRSYYSSGRSHSYSYSRGYCEPRRYYSREYYRPAPHYYRSAPRYSYSDRCYTERRSSFRPPLISFLFGF